MMTDAKLWMNDSAPHPDNGQTGSHEHEFVLYYLFGRNSIAFDWLRNRENLSFYKGGKNRGKANDMKPDGIADSYSNAAVGANGFYLKELGKKAAEMAEKEAIQNVLQETRWNRKEAAKIPHVSYKALLYKIKRYLLNEQKGPMKRNNDHENRREMRWDGEQSSLV